MSSQDVIELIHRAKAQDQNAYNLLFGGYWNSLYSFLYKRTSNPNLAEELAIESFAKAFDQLERFDEKLSFNSWLITIGMELMKLTVYYWVGDYYLGWQ